MKKWRMLLDKLLHPATGTLIALVVISVPAVTFALLFLESAHPVSLLAYLLSAYTLTAVCIRAPSVLRKAVQRVKANRYIARYLSDPALRVRISLYGSLAINLLYAALQLASGIINHTVWFYSLSAYYSLLSLMRFLLLRETRKGRVGHDLRREFWNYRGVGIALMNMNLVLGAICFYIVRQNRGFSHPPIINIAMAAYTFYVFPNAIIQLVKYRKYESPVLSASKAINFASALVSLLSLETAMIGGFGQETAPAFRQIVTGITSAVVCTTILVMAVYMVVRGTRMLRRSGDGSR